MKVQPNSRTTTAIFHVAVHAITSLGIHLDIKKSARTPRRKKNCNTIFNTHRAGQR